MILILKTALGTATFSKGNVAQELRRDNSCATLRFAFLCYVTFFIDDDDDDDSIGGGGDDGDNGGNSSDSIE